MLRPCHSSGFRKPARFESLKACAAPITIRRPDHILPFEPEELALAQTRGYGEHIERFEPAATFPYCLKESTRLGGGEGVDLFALGPRGFDCLGDVAGNQPVGDRVLERFVQRGVDVLDGTRR